MESKILELISFGSATLKEAGIDNSKYEAELLLSYVMKKSRIKLYVELNQFIPQERVDIFRNLIRERATRKPLQYILGNVNFYGLELSVRESIFIPRPETEVLVDTALDFIKNRFDKVLKVLDIGTGSGNIAISIAKNSNIVNVYAMDSSPDAIKCATENAENNGVSHKIKFMQKSIYDDYNEIKNITGYIDVIVSNPPYIPTDEIKNLMPEISKYEPMNALNGGADGLDLFKKIMLIANGLLDYNGIMIVEIGDGQKKPVEEFASKYFSIDFINDLQGKPRFLTAEKSS